MSTSDAVHVTPRQREVVKLIALGLSAEEIAKRLNTSSRTVRAHTDALRARLGVRWLIQMQVTGLGGTEDGYCSTN